MAEAAPSESYLLVAAIDFGTTFSGYAYSFKNDPMKIQTNASWIAGTEKLLSLKTPTCVLLNPSKEFDSFGFEAENKFVNLADDNEHGGWMLFQKFKMILHNKEGLSRNTEVDDINGKRMPALTIFSMAINYMRGHLMTALKNQVTDIRQSDVMFVITVPAIWSDASKQFMREAAVAGGIADDHIKLSLEPEAASIWCQHVNVGKQPSFCKTGNKYMVVDLGGGTVDVSVHEKNLDGTLKELHRASGGPWGGTCVDSNYIDWLTQMFGKVAMERLKRESLGDYVDMLREFENKKRSITPDTKGLITLRVSVALKEYHDDSDEENIESKIARMNLKEEVKFQRDKMRVSVDIARKWFNHPIDMTIRHITGILAEPKMKDVNTVLLVGGFGECKLVQEAVKKTVGERIVIIPDEAGLAVLKGAVRFGHQPRLVSHRCVKFTYGYGVSCRFDESKHPPEKMIKGSYGDERVTDCFKKVVEIGSSVEVGNDIEAPVRYILKKTGGTKLKIYTSTERNPEYVTDPSCTKVGELDLGKSPGETKDENKTQVYFAFGDTELRVSVKMLKTGEVLTKIVDCL